MLHKWTFPWASPSFCWINMVNLVKQDYLIFMSTWIFWIEMPAFAFFPGFYSYSLSLNCIVFTDESLSSKECSSCMHSATSGTCTLLSATSTGGRLRSVPTFYRIIYDILLISSVISVLLFLPVWVLWNPNYEESSIRSPTGSPMLLLPALSCCPRPLNLISLISFMLPEFLPKLSWWWLLGNSLKLLLASWRLNASMYAFFSRDRFDD